MKFFEPLSVSDKHSGLSREALIALKTSSSNTNNHNKLQHPSSDTMAVIVPLRRHINLDPMNLDSFIESKFDEITNRIKTLIIQTSRSSNDYSTSLQIELLETHLKFLRRECDCIVCLLCEDELYDPIMNIINEYVARHNDEVKVRQREEEAVTKIQSVFRGNAVRHRLTKAYDEQHREEAVTKIQSVFRGNAVRHRLTKAYIWSVFYSADNALKNPNAAEEEVEWAEDIMLKIRKFMDDTYAREKEEAKMRQRDEEADW